MIKSMTGYGRNQANLSGYDITIEIRSVNHRYFEFSSRIPRAYAYLEEKLKSYIHERVSRGKVDVFVGIVPVDTADTVVHINHALAGSYLEELTSLGADLGLVNDVTLSTIARFNDIYSIHRESEDEDVVWAIVKEAAEPALDQFIAMREVEGEKMKDDILSRLDVLEHYTGEIEKNSPEIVSQWREKLYAKVSAVLDDRQVDEQRLLTEVAMFAEKVAVDEETIRLRSHIHQFHSIILEEDAVGRKLDFLVQEINREINTIGSKSQDVNAAKLVVEMKSETEKIREQIQNIE